MASETVETTVVEVATTNDGGVYTDATSMSQSTIGEPTAEEFVVVETAKVDAVPGLESADALSKQHSHGAVSSSSSSVPQTDLAAAQTASLAIEEATRVLSAAGIDASSMPQVITHLVQLTQQQQQQQGQQPPSSTQQAANQAAILQALAMAQQSSASLVPAAVQTVVLSANGAQQPQVAGRLTSQTLSSEAAASLAGKLQSPLTIQWLLDHFEIAEGMSLPRYALFTFYLDFCSQHGVQPVNAASFGKVIRQVFPVIKTRRLGTRGQSKYHYYGIGVKSNSPYHSAMVTAARRQASLTTKAEATGEGATSALDSAAAGNQASLAGFPDLQIADLDDVGREKVSMFLMMYRAHCQSILDAVVRNNFGEVLTFITHFWTGMPEHLLPILQNIVVAKLIGTCDLVMYKAIITAILPPAIEPLSLNLTHSVRNFAKQLNSWISKGCVEMPEALQKIKEEIGFMFTGALRRRTSVSHLAQATRSVLQSQDSVQQMLVDWKQLDLTSITYQSVSTFQQSAQEFIDLYVEFMLEFEDLLEQQANVESFAAWLNSVVERCVLQPWRKETGKFEDLARNFLLLWQFFTTRVVRDLTLRSAPSFGSYHLLSMLFEDYILYLLERELQAQKETSLQETIGTYFTVSPDGDEEEDEEEDEESDEGGELDGHPSVTSPAAEGVGQDGTALLAASSAVTAADRQPVINLTAGVSMPTSIGSAGDDSTGGGHGRPQLLAVAASPPAKRRKDSEDEEEEDALRGASASPQCTTPDPLMRSIGVGPNLPLDVSNAALLFGGQVSAAPAAAAESSVTGESASQ